VVYLPFGNREFCHKKAQTEKFSAASALK